MGENNRLCYVCEAQELEYGKAYLERLCKVMQNRIDEQEQQNKRYREAIKKAKNAMSLVVGGEGSATKTAHNILRKALEESE